MSGIILYGPPASGKSTITRTIESLDARFSRFQLLKSGGESGSEYRTSSPQELLDPRSGIIWKNDRYGSTYAIDRTGLIEAIERGLPILNLGTAQAVEAVTLAIPTSHWLVVELRCSRTAALRRLRERGDRNTRERMAVWDQTEELLSADVVIDTGSMPALAAATAILQDFSTRVGYE